MENKLTWEDILPWKLIASQTGRNSSLSYAEKERLWNETIECCIKKLEQAEKEGKVVINPPIQELENIYQGLKENSLEPDKVICIAGHLKKVIQAIEGKI